MLNLFPCEKRREISALDLIVDFTPTRPFLHAKTLAALAAASSQDGTTTLGSHASTEAVGLGALALIRLISALHYRLPFTVRNIKSRVNSRTIIPRKTPV